jgi:hypothetical protein
MIDFVGCIARIRELALLALLTSLSTVGIAQSQMPDGFHWVDFKKEASTVSDVEQALKAENYTAIREIGLSDGFALVLAVWREPGQSTPEGDQWLVYSVSTRDWKAQTLLSGYNLQIRDWITFQRNTRPDIAIVYLDCWECEPASLFTALHYDPHDGWRARWVNEKNPQQPGIPFLFTDVGDPYTNEDVDQVFAVFTRGDNVASVGTWYHARDLSTGKVSESVSRYSVDASTGKDNEAGLKGQEASKWIVQLCKADGSSSSVLEGQSSRGCKRVLSTQRKTSR